MCSILCHLLFKHSYNGLSMADSIANVSENYLLRICSLSISQPSWTPHISSECRRNIAISITKATKQLKLPIINMTMNTTEYMCDQIACYISNCVLQNELLDFKNNESIEIDNLLTKKVDISQEIYNSFKEKFSKMNDGSIIEINTSDPIEVEVLRLKFDILIKSLIEKMDFIFIINETYQDYTKKKNIKNYQIRQSYSKFI